MRGLGLISSAMVQVAGAPAQCKTGELGGTTMDDYLLPINSVQRLDAERHGHAASAAEFVSGSTRGPRDVCRPICR